MALHLSTPELRAALALVKPIIAARNTTIPILQCVVIRTDAAGAVTLTVTDLEIAITIPIPTTEHPPESFAAVIPHKALSGMLAATKAASVALDLETIPSAGSEGDPTFRCHIRVGGATSTLSCLAVKDFPSIAAPNMPYVMTLPCATLRDVFGVPQHAISTEEARYYLNGVFMDCSGEGLLTVSTDGSRLATHTLPAVAIAGKAPPSLIVPRFTVAALLKALPKGGNAVTCWCDTRISFILPGGTVILSKVIDGTYPEWQRSVPRENPYRVTADTRELAEIIKRVASVSNERTRPVKLTMADNHLTVSAFSYENGSASETMNSGRVTTPAESLEIGYQARYLLEMLANVGPTVEMAFNTGADPAVFTDALRPGRLFCIMPCRI